MVLVNLACASTRVASSLALYVKGLDQRSITFVLPQHSTASDVRVREAFFTTKSECTVDVLVERLFSTELTQTVLRQAVAVSWSRSIVSLLTQSVSAEHFCER